MLGSMAPRKKVTPPPAEPEPATEEPAAPLAPGVQPMCDAVQDDALQQMWSKGWQGPAFDTFEAVAVAAAGGAHIVKVRKPRCKDHDIILLIVFLCI